MSAPRRGYRMDVRAQDLALTRDRIIASALELFGARSFTDVTLNDIADGADVTRQTVLNHFNSKDGVFLAAAKTVKGRRELATPGDIGSALDELVAEYEEVGDTLMRLIDVEARFEAVHTVLDEGRRGHRTWVEATFAEHLPREGEDRATSVLALVAATDLYVWKLLRRDLGLPRTQVRAVIGTLVAGALSRSHLEAKEAL